MVTSAVFGSIRLMSSEDRRKAVEVLLGRDAFEAAALTADCDIEVELWPRLAGLEGRRHVEPDVLLKAAGTTIGAFVSATISTGRKRGASNTDDANVGSVA